MLFGEHMIKFFQGFRAVLSIIRFNSLPSAQRRITFYSEGRNYWPHLEGLLRTVLKETNLPVCYISSSFDDPGLQFNHPNLNCFFIGLGYTRDYLFQNIDTDIVVMTMPDLHQYQVKRSYNKVHYIYVPHSLVSLHMAYRHGAFDHYDTICCAGPHHVQEVRAIEDTYKLSRKKIIKQGYSRLDNLIQIAEKKYKTRIDSKEKKKYKKILIAPSWGKEGLIESGLGYKLIDELIELNHKIIFRPHPQTIKFCRTQVKKIILKHRKNPYFSFEDDVSSQESFHQSDLMISDWSGVALEYAFAFKKPIIFCDIPRKINNPNYKKIGIIPLEILIRDKIGIIWDGIEPISKSLKKCIKIKNIDTYADKIIFNIGNSDKEFCKQIFEKIKK